MKSPYYLSVAVPACIAHPFICIDWCSYSLFIFFFFLFFFKSQNEKGLPGHEKELGLLRAKVEEMEKANTQGKVIILPAAKYFFSSIYLARAHFSVIAASAFSFGIVSHLCGLSVCYLLWVFLFPSLFLFLFLLFS